MDKPMIERDGFSGQFAKPGASFEVPRLKPILLKELMSMEFPPNRWIVEGLVPDSAITALSGLSGSYKTWIQLLIAQSVASGTDFLGHFPVKKTNVLILDEENGLSLLQQRLRHLHFTPELSVHLNASHDVKLNDEFVTGLLVYCAEHHIRLVIVDSLIRFHTGDENDAVQMAQLFGRMKRLPSADIAVIFLHHHGKAAVGRSRPATDMRGSSEILAAVDSHIAIERENNRLTFTQTKLRYDEEHKPFTVLVERGTDGSPNFAFEGGIDPRLPKKEEVKYAVIELLGAQPEPLSQNELRDALKETGITVGEHNLRDALRELEEEDEIRVGQGERNKKLYSVIDREPPEQQLDLGDKS